MADLRAQTLQAHQEAALAGFRTQAPLARKENAAVRLSGVDAAIQCPDPHRVPPPSRARRRRRRATQARMWFALDPDMYRQNKNEISDEHKVRDQYKNILTVDSSDEDAPNPIQNFAQRLLSDDSEGSDDGKLCPLCMEEVDLDGSCECGYNPNSAYIPDRGRCRLRQDR